MNTLLWVIIALLSLIALPLFLRLLIGLSLIFIGLSGIATVKILSIYEKYAK